MRVRAFLLAVLLLALFPVAASASFPHVVQPGETLTSVAAVDGLSVNAIATANGISNQSQLVAGQILWIPPRSPLTAGAGTAATSSTQTTVVTTQATASTQTNSDPDADSDVDSGTSGTASSSAATASTSSSASTSSTATTEAASASPQQNVSAAVPAPVPTQERVTASQIAAIASSNGVPPALAEAIAWQESGWNNAEVSGVGAVGVMQIVPRTWTWIDRFLTPSVPLGNASAAENIRAGVLLLHQLLQLTGGNEPLAVAGYFQGLASVTANGMYAGTRQYVADVMALTQRFGG